MAFLYWITDDVTKDITNYGYVGITRNSVDKRINSHVRSYKLHLKDTNNVGCKLLYSKIQKLGGWNNVKIVTVCESTIEYCIYLENKLRPEPEIGWNIRVGGEYHVMYKRQVTQETKDKLRLVRSSWVMSDSSRNKLSVERTGVLNPMYSVKPWENPSSTDQSKISWLKADVVFETWLCTKFGTRKITKIFCDLNYWSIDSMIRKFRSGWNPKTDIEWLRYKETYESKKT